MFVQATNSAAKARAMEYDRRTALSVLTRHRGPRPVVIGQLGQSLDGRIATPTGASKYINGQEALRHLHRIRAEVDAVIIGVGTAIADNPQLTTRHVEGPNPVRVVIDPHGRMPRDLTMLSDGAAPVLAVTCRDASAPEGAEALPLDCDGTARIVERMRVPRAQVSSADYPKLRAFASAVRAARAQRLVAVPKAR